jgi:hypothetical protein
MSSPDFPTIPHDLLLALEQAYPEKSPDLNESVETLRHRGGQASVVRHLRRIYNEQNETVLANPDAVHVLLKPKNS